MSIKMMYETDSIKHRLQSYKEAEKDIEYQFARIELLSERMQNVGSPSFSYSGKSSGSNQEKIPELVSKKIYLEEKLNIDIAKHQKELEYLENIVEQLDSSDKKAVIRLRYFDNNPWSDVVFCLFGGRKDFVEKQETYTRRIHKLHKAALIDMSKITADKSLGDNPSGSSNTPLQEEQRQKATLVNKEHKPEGS